ncbi:MAG: hypothetical protein ACYTGM_17250 [Planctomycetota bacterium]
MVQSALVGTSDPPRRLVSPAAVVIHVALFLMAFIGACHLFGALLPQSPHSVRSVKLDHFAKHKDEYDTIFLGSSRVYRGINPETFDGETAALGLPTRSFNFGVSGMVGLETEFVLNEILAMKPARLRWVFIEPAHLRLRIADENARTQRVISWHDLGSTLSATRGLLTADHGELDRLREIWKHWQAYCYRMTNLGGARLELDEPPRRARALEPGTVLGKKRNGYQPLDVRRRKRRHLEFLNQLEQYREEVENLAEREVPAEPLDGFNARYLTRLRDAVESFGATPIFLITPSSDRGHSDYVINAHREGLISRLMRFDDPRRFPDLFEVDARFDAAHLSRKGASLLSQSVADRFVIFTGDARTP